ncbi:hypothetical protein CgunFtcFv8_019052 [Champsocephalus gunnari]|uniref:Uncharacterized protein n=1 Tax=Champsocephalus gunnari TaxID=52237 RepID=A0AAN8DH16_CHAGU|nr:hypothetical protein CgunFtcFv8_019052 [Champsocephalus gunnari]
MMSLNTSTRNRFTTISDPDLDEHVRRLHNQFPRSGSEMMRAYLHAEGIVVQRRRVRDSKANRSSCSSTEMGPDCG